MVGHPKVLREGALHPISGIWVGGSKKYGRTAAQTVPSFGRLSDSFLKIGFNLYKLTEVQHLPNV